jgi:DNA-binding SARP family transcriptional activator
MASRSGAAQPAEPTALALQVYLLGPPAVAWADHPLAVPRRQVRALLYRLAACPQPVPREHLCFLFWPDTSECICHRQLSHLLTHLRLALPAPEVLLDTDDHVGLDPHRVWSDAAAFIRLRATPEPQRPTKAHQQALDLYRGPFLTGFSLPNSPEFEAWVAMERQSLERLYLEALVSMIEEQTARGAYDDAIACAQRYLATDDLAEEVHSRLMVLYAVTGNRRAALRQFELCVAVLERELGISPLPETRAIHQAVLEGRPPLPGLRVHTRALRIPKQTEAKTGNTHYPELCQHYLDAD